MRKIKHLKTRNTGFLYEVLLKQFTIDVLNNVENPKSLYLIKKYYSSNKPLFEELSLYNALMSAKRLERNKSDALIDEVLKSRIKLNEQNLIKNKYNLVRELKENYNIDSLFTTKVNNYKLIASIYVLFESVLSKEGIFNPSTVVNSRFTIIEHITSANTANDIIEEHQDIISKFKEQNKIVKTLTLQNIIKKFNKKYEGLTIPQKKLLRTYISSISSGALLESYLVAEVPKVKIELESLKIDDKVLKIKINEISNRLVRLLDNTSNKYNRVLQLMKIYEIIEEVKNCNIDTREEILD
jgi:hypothetical protein